jgi:hypothetical protein
MSNAHAPTPSSPASRHQKTRPARSQPSPGPTPRLPETAHTAAARSSTLTRELHSLAEFLRHRPAPGDILFKIHSLLLGFQNPGHTNRTPHDQQAIDALLKEFHWQTATPPAHVHPAYRAAHEQAQVDPRISHLSICPFCGQDAVQLVAFQATCRTPVAASGWTITGEHLQTSQEEFACNHCGTTVPPSLVFVL